MGGENKVGGMGTAMHVGRPMGREQVENEKKKMVRKERRERRNTYLTDVDMGGREHGHDEVAEGRRS